MNMMSSRYNSYYPSTPSRYKASNTDNHASIYGPKENLVGSYRRTSNSLLAKYESPKMGLPSRTGTSFNSATDRNKLMSSYIPCEPKIRQPSPPKQSYTFTSPTNSTTSDLVRPSMRDRSGLSPLRRALPSNTSVKSTSVGRKYHNSSLDRTPTRDRLPSPVREKPSSIVSRLKSPGTSDLKLSTSSTASSYKTSVLSPKSSPVLNGLTQTSRKPKEQITIDEPPYKSGYVPSYSRTSSPKRQVESKTVASALPKGDGATGLKNIGNTCFMNSILQCLSHTVLLRDYCLGQQYQYEINERSSMKGKLMKAFAEIIKDLWSGTTSSVIPSTFKTQIQKFSPRFMGYEQQDSQEFLRFLLEGLHEDINKVLKKSSEPLKDLSHKRPQEIAQETWLWYGKKDKSFIFDLFVGQLESNLVCSHCENVSLTYDPFWDLSLPISKKASYLVDSSHLADCLRSFTKEEVLDRDEKPMCEKCKTRRKMTKKLSIHRFPRILVIHLKRFHEGSRYRQKDSSFVNFPVEKQLRLEEFASATCEDKSSTTYNLYAVSNHCGSCYGGHYTAYCLNPSARQWREFNDSRISILDEDDICTKEAYVLFYVQKSDKGRSSRL